jgi:hypothetical protein
MKLEVKKKNKKQQKVLNTIIGSVSDRKSLSWPACPREWKKRRK